MNKYQQRKGNLCNPFRYGGGRFLERFKETFEKNRTK